MNYFHEIFKINSFSDAAALQCCSGHTEEDIKKHLLTHMLDIFNPEKFEEFQGDLIPNRIRMIKDQKEKFLQQKKQRQLEYEKKMEEQRAKEREYIKKKRAKEQLARELENQKNSSNYNNNNSNSKVVDLSYDNVELKPKIDEEPINKKVKLKKTREIK